MSCWKNGGVIALSGDDTRTFLQGLISNNSEKVTAENAIHAAFLTPQGKYLHDFFIAQAGEELLLDCESARLDDLLRRLSMYKLRAKVTLIDARPTYAVAAIIGDGASSALGLGTDAGHAVAVAGGVAYIDPRLAAAGGRAMLPRDTAVQRLEEAGLEAAKPGDYDALRLRLGLPDGSSNLIVDKAILLENGFEELNGVDFEKGCFLGQELTARTKHRALVRKRLLPVTIEGEAPPFGAPVMLGDKEAGEMRSSRGGDGLALMRLEFLDKAADDGTPFTVGNARLFTRKPDWAAF